MLTDLHGDAATFFVENCSAFGSLAFKNFVRSCSDNLIMLVESGYGIVH